MIKFLIKQNSYTERFTEDQEREARARYDALADDHRARGRGTCEMALLEQGERGWQTVKTERVARESGAAGFAAIRAFAFERCGAQDALPFHGLRSTDGKFVSLND